MNNKKMHLSCLSLYWRKNLPLPANSSSSSPFFVIISDVERLISAISRHRKSRRGNTAKEEDECDGATCVWGSRASVPGLFYQALGKLNPVNEQRHVEAEQNHRPTSASDTESRILFIHFHSVVFFFLISPSPWFIISHAHLTCHPHWPPSATFLPSAALR